MSISTSRLFYIRRSLGPTQSVSSAAANRVLLASNLLSSSSSSSSPPEFSSSSIFVDRFAESESSIGAGLFGCVQQSRFRNKINSTSLLQQQYNRLSIRKKWRRAIKRGTMQWDPSIGQVVMPPLQVQGYTREKPYTGKFENCKALRIEFEK